MGRNFLCFEKKDRGLQTGIVILKLTHRHHSMSGILKQVQDDKVGSSGWRDESVAVN